jgi:hypothetical protein
MAFSNDLRRIALRIEPRTRDVYAHAVNLVSESIVFGSDLTGAPGQPVDTDEERSSWQTVHESDVSAVVGTNLDYSLPIEDGVGPHGPRVYGAKNGIGGSHSVALTEAGFPAIVAEANRRVPGGPT